MSFFPNPFEWNWNWNPLNFLNSFHGAHHAEADHVEDEPVVEKDVESSQGVEEVLSQENIPPTTTEVRSDEPPYYHSISLHSLLCLTHTDVQNVSRQKIKSIETEIQGLIATSQAMQEVMAQLELVSNEDNVVLQNVAQLQEAVNALKDRGISNQLLEKEQLTSNERDALVRFLQHKVAGTRQELDHKKTAMQEAVELFSSLSKALNDIAEKEHQIIKKIFSHAAR